MYITNISNRFEIWLQSQWLFRNNSSEIAKKKKKEEKKKKRQPIFPLNVTFFGTIEWFPKNFIHLEVNEYNVFCYIFDIQFVWMIVFSILNESWRWKYTRIKKKYKRLPSSEMVFFKCFELYRIKLMSTENTLEFDSRERERPNKNWTKKEKKMINTCRI